MIDLLWLHLGSGKSGDLNFIYSLTNSSKLKQMSFYSISFGGVLPKSLTNLSTQLINVLNIGGNQFVGTIPLGISNFVNLIELGLESNYLSGPIPL